MKSENVVPDYFVPQLTFTRFLAVVWIVIFHYGRQSFPFSADPFLQKLATHGYLVVTFFFVLSGFTLAVRYFRRQIDPIAFVLARFARIYPLYALSVLFFVAFYAYWGRLDRAMVTIPIGRLDTALDRAIVTIPLNLTLLQAWVPSFTIRLSFTSWFLSALFSLYVMFPLLFDRFRRLTPTKIALWSTLIWLGSFAVLILLQRTIYGGATSASHDLLYYNPLMHLNSFVIGIAGGVLFRAHVVHRRDAQGWGWTLVVGSLAALLALSAHDDGGLFHNGLLAPLFLLGIVGLALDTSWLSRVFSNKLCLALGNMSFGVYILQEPVMLSLMAAIGRIARAPVFFFPYLLILLFVSALAVSFIEQPMHRFLLKRIQRKRIPSPP